ncbi:putative drug exporter of the RND superfamily [Marininema mesophilum]|uniref:Putative drug exporter of the RND superfamily n=1 Tax=Marininema mesophilum TaxID=1048340 RepID=A0A1H3B442_9BACL|nr:MMPL family transporter [Marininema mesophilum]SDX36391.1 putative drug exporter of the RND superfamily [Marininema mesophilum]
MRTVLRYKWVVLIAWVAMVILSIVTMPDLGQMTRESEPKIHAKYSSQMANNLKKEMSNSSKNSKDVDILVVFHSDKPLTKNELSEIEKGVDNLESNKKLGVSNVITHFNEKELKDQFVSKDKSTVMTLFTVNRSGKQLSDVREDVRGALKSVSVDHYLTGNKLIQDDFGQTTLKGVKKTETITVAFIIVVLIAVFRSPVAPVISLLSVGISYITSLAVVAHMVQWWDFPFANFTQIFLILVLFGIGTDYNILLFARFKEELSQRKSISESIVVTYQTAGKTVFYSAIAVFIGFSCLAFAKFSVYQAGVAVAVGVLFLIASLLTVVPFFMSVLGMKMFWPVKKVKGKVNSRIWPALSSFSYRRPLLGLLIVALITVPILFFHQGKLSYNSLDEVDNSYESLKGFNIVAKEFTPGQTMPVEVVLKSDKKLDSSEALAFIDEVTNSLRRVPEVDTVYGPTQPKGNPIEAAYVNKQTKKTNEGIGKAEKGTEQINSGLKKILAKMNAGSKDMSQVDQLYKGTKAAQQGVQEVGKASKQIQAGLDKGASGAEELNTGLTKMRSGVEILVANTSKLNSGYNSLYAGYKKLGDGANRLQSLMDQIKPLAAGVKVQVYGLNPQGPGEQAKVAALKEKVNPLDAQVKILDNGLQELNVGFTGINSRFAEANAGLNKITTEQKKLLAGLTQMEQGSRALAAGLKKGSAGEAQVVDALGQIDTGLGRVANGQGQLNDGLYSMDNDLKKLQGGLSKSSKGLGEIDKGLNKAQGYLGEVAGTKASHTFFLPKAQRTGKDFQKSLDAYMSGDRHILKWNIVLEGDPYSEKAMKTAGDIDQTISDKLKKTKYSDSKYGVGGLSSQNRDLNKLSTEDFTRTATYMMLGIALVLLWMLRSFWNTVYIIASLVISYFSALAFTEVIFREGFGYPGLTWSTPFFSMIMIVSLGVDYSIFLMMRYLEYRDWTPGKAVVEASRKIGGVVFSAAIILSGTFAALYPSGILTLMQVATVVILGLFIMAFLMLPLFLPGMMAVTRRLNADPDGPQGEKGSL